MSDEGYYAAYQRYAKYYNLYFGLLMNPGRAKAISIANLKPGERVLEVGVGTGLSLPFYPPEVEVSGIDLSKPMLSRAEELVSHRGLGNVKLLTIMNAEEMTFADNSFDCVMAMHVSTVVGNPGRFAAEMQRVCRPGGRLIIVNYFHDPGTAVGKVAQILTPFAKHIGFRPDLTLEEFLHKTRLKIDQATAVNLFHIHKILVVQNQKLKN
jgi:phosphatidylethanolamine/phosphatidyl-N-methylethanolamine N-methyltransferase